MALEQQIPLLKRKNQSLIKENFISLISSQKTNHEKNWKCYKIITDKIMIKFQKLFKDTKEFNF